MLAFDSIESRGKVPLSCENCARKKLIQAVWKSDPHLQVLSVDQYIVFFYVHKLRTELWSSLTRLFLYIKAVFNGCSAVWLCSVITIDDDKIMLVSVRKIKQCLSFYIVIGNSVVTVLIEKKKRRRRQVPYSHCITVVF